MKSARPTEAKTSALEPGLDSITARLQPGEIVAALDYPESERPLFWSAIAIFGLKIKLNKAIMLH
jgi:hypothetical protein